MKTFIHVDQATAEVAAVGMIYFEDGSLTFADRAAEIGVDAAILEHGEEVCPRLVDPVTGADLGPMYKTHLVDVAALPGGAGMRFDKLFRGAWEKSGAAVVENLVKSKLIAHGMRRAKRAAELAPLDVQATIPSQATAAEAARQKIRDDYAVIQVNVDAAADTTALRTVLAAMQARP